MPLDISYSMFPRIFKGQFTLEEPGDGFLDMRPLKRGIVWVNGYNLGRYWDIGPQKSLYVPGCWLNKGKNELIILENVQFAKPGLIRKGMKIKEKNLSSGNKKEFRLVLRPEKV